MTIVDKDADSRLYSIVTRRLREARLAQGVSQDAVAAATGMTRSSVANFERGRQHPPLHKLYRYAEEVGLEVRELFPSLSELREGIVGAPATVRVGGQVVEVPSHHVPFVLQALGKEKP